MTRTTIPTAEDYELAKKVAEWMLSLSESEQTSDYLHNLGIWGKHGRVEPKGYGIVASAVGAYQRDVEKKLKAQASVVSKHIGEVGARINLHVRLVGLHSTEGHYGATHIHRFEILDGEDASAQVVWFGSSLLRQESGDEMWIKGTIKQHNEYRGTKQTIVSRVLEMNDPETEKKLKAEAAKKARARKKEAGQAKETV